MKHSTTLFLTAMMGSMLLQGCAHSAIDQRIDDKLTQETAIKHRADLSAEANELIKSAPGLSDEQRAELAQLRDKSAAELDSISAQSIKLRGLLIQDVVSSNYDQDEVQAIKTRLKNLENKRLSLVFDTVDQANTILGHQALEHQQIINSFMMETHGTRMQ